MIHQYKNNGFHIVMDVNSGAIHIVDEVVYDMLPLYQEHSLEEIKTLLQDRYTADEIGEAAAVGKRLSGNHRAVEGFDEREAGRYCCYGYAPSGYQTGQRSDRNAD